MTRATLRQAVRLAGDRGILSGREIELWLEPALPGAGIRIRRRDTGDEWPADIAHTLARQAGPPIGCTTVGQGEVSVSFIEHAMAALCAAGISDAVLSVDGAEMPLFDGSAMPVWSALAEAGRHETDAEWHPLVIRAPVCVCVDGKLLLGNPSEAPEFTYVLDHPDPLVGVQVAHFSAGDDFGSALAPARTFATEQYMREVLKPEQWSRVERHWIMARPEGLSAPVGLPDAFARHKLVDLIGDLYLCGKPIVGRIVAYKTGHSENHAFVRELLAGCIDG